MNVERWYSSISFRGIVVVCIAATASSCSLKIRGGKSTDKETAAVTTPTPTPLPNIYSLSYSEAPAIYVKNRTITSATPTVTGGTPTLYSISPALPAGLSFDTSTGQISGSATAAATPSDYTITALSDVGTGSTTLRLTVKAGGGFSAQGVGGTGTAASSWLSTTVQTAAGSVDGAFDLPSDIAIDTTNGFFYVADKNNGRITKHNLTTGAFVGWIGNIQSTPTGGDAGCSTAFGFTPGWCTGGRSHGSLGNMPTLVHVVAIQLDVANNRFFALSDSYIAKFTLSTGQMQGWIGKIGGPPTGGDPGCSGAAAGTVTPGWCTGGYASNGNGMGMFSGAAGLAVDVTGDVLYVADSNNYRVDKFTLSTGAFVGWVGKVGTTPTGGGGTCSSTAVDGFTPDWCTGGAAKMGSESTTTSFSNLGKLHLNSARTFLYVTDLNMGTLRKLDVTNGQVVGWQGRIVNVPTGGDAGCTTAASGTYTPGWCTGGTGAFITTNDSLSWLNDFALDETNSKIYTFATYTGEIHKLGLAGGFIGWFGRIFTSPTGGDAGCSGAAVNSTTPGWCTGGLGATGVMTGSLGMGTSSGIDVDPASSKLYIADAPNHRIVRISTNATTYEWIGMQVDGSTGWSSSALTKTAGMVDSTFTNIKGVAVDAANNAFYVNSNYKIQKFNLTSGALIGWIGQIDTVPTGGAAGCATAAIGSFTPGWCTGGIAGTSGNSSGGFYGSGGLAIDSANDLIYVADYNRVSKYRASTGAYLGYFGRIGNAPTGGDPGCAGLGSGNVTPGWCTGGSSSAGSGNGNFNGAYQIALDSTGGFLYVNDRYNNRVVKMSTAGSFVGWIGKVSSTPTGGASGCSVAAVGSSTPGWCVGGGATSGTESGAFNDPHSLSVDPDRSALYVSDYNNHRIEKFDSSSGAFIGWIGKVSTSPTGGGSACTSAATGTVTPTWCSGGSAQSASTDKAFYYPSGIHVDSASGALYVQDISGRVQVFNSVTTSMIGWVGYVSTNPTSGYTGCTTSIGSLTPGFCLGGASSTNNFTSMGYSSYPEQLDYDPSSGQLYITDTTSNRMQKLNNM